ncbi:MAG: ImmA/IrrE family metallo-endopeptidase, partial [Thermoguttaceae bacterium]
MLPELTREELAAGMDAVVFEILNEAGIHGPPVDAMDLARRLGITVATDEFQEGRARYVRLRGGHPSQLRPTILLRPFDRRERQHWAVAHEIGEHAAYRVFAAWGADPRETPPRAREETANCLAGRLLVPTAWFAPDGL